MVVILGVAGGKQPWLWETAAAVALVLLLINVGILAAVHIRRVRQSIRARRARRFRSELQEILGELESPGGPRDPQRLQRRLSELNELERPLAAVALIERLRPASDAEREHTLEALRDAGAIDPILRSTRRRMPWRRALAIRTLGWIGAPEAVPVLIERVGDRNRYVRESAVRALGRIGDARAVPTLSDLLRSPGRVGAGVVYDALIELGPQVAPVFAGALGSEREPVRVAACYGVAALSDAAAARDLLDPALEDPSAAVRTAAADALGQVGGSTVPERLARATRDAEPTVRSAAVGALAAYDDAYAVELAQNALLDPSWLIAVRAGESLVRLAQRSAASSAADEVLRRRRDEWPIERAVTFASLGAA